MPLHPAAPADLPAVVDLVNLAYRGSDAGWNTEAGYIVGDRLTLSLLQADLEASPQARLLVWRDAPDEPLLGCVWLEPAGVEACYLGMLTVRPDLQARRLGRTILEEAERLAGAQGARRVRMTVVNVRDGLIAWYLRRGYALTGETLPFPYDDARFDVPTRGDLAFIVLERALAGDLAGAPG
jgi:ribosomal protein S18 acetylase RimI-like enzyme